jgi:hypothetical protein
MPTLDRVIFACFGPTVLAAYEAALGRVREDG